MTLIARAEMQDALAIQHGSILVDGNERGFVTGLSIDGKSPEDLISCISGSLRRKKPATVERSADAVVLYENLIALDALKSGAIFQIVINFNNPDSSNPDNLGMVLTVTECRIESHTITIGESSTFKMSGKARSWAVTVS